MSAAEIIEQIKALFPEGRAEVVKFVVESDDSWVPEDFKEFTIFDLQPPKGFVFAVAISTGDAGRRVDLGLGFRQSIIIAAASVIFERPFKRQSDLAFTDSWAEDVDLGSLPLEAVSLEVVREMRWMSKGKPRRSRK